MGFYKTLFGALFFASLACSIDLIRKGQWTLALFLSIVILLIIINDFICTTQELETDMPSYSIEMKFIDLFQFFCLGFSIVVLSPLSNKIYVLSQDDVSGLLQSELRFVVIWGVLLIDFFFGIVWDMLLKRNKLKKSVSLLEIIMDNDCFQLFFIAVCGAQVLLLSYFFASESSIVVSYANGLNIIFTGTLVYYVFIYKINKFKKQIIRRPVEKTSGGASQQ